MLSRTLKLYKKNLSTAVVYSTVYLQLWNLTLIVFLIKTTWHFYLLYNYTVYNLLSKANAKTNMIRCRLKLRAAVLLLLILRNGAFVEGDISCLRGINVDGTPGYNNKNIPTSTLCQPEEMCLRVRIDELKSDTGSKCQLNYF